MEIKKDEFPEEILLAFNGNNNNERLDRSLVTISEIQDWLVAYLADLLEIEIDEVDVTIPFDRYGLDSAALVGTIGDLATWMGCELDPILPYEYPTITDLSAYLAEESKGKI
jgi:acyl carrier protein